MCFNFYRQIKFELAAPKMSMTKQGSKISAVLAPGMGAFLASEKLRRGLVSASRLKEPPESCIVTAFRALYGSSGHSLNFFFLVTYNFQIS